MKTRRRIVAAVFAAVLAAAALVPAGSGTEVVHIDLRTLRVTRLFTVRDHIGGNVLDPTTGRLVGDNRGSQTFYEWTRTGGPFRTWQAAVGG